MPTLRLRRKSCKKQRAADRSHWSVGCNEPLFIRKIYFGHMFDARTGKRLIQTTDSHNHQEYRDSDLFKLHFWPREVA